MDAFYFVPAPEPTFAEQAEAVEEAKRALTDGVIGRVYGFDYDVEVELTTHTVELPPMPIDQIFTAAAKEVFAEEEARCCPTCGQKIPC